MGLVKQAMMTVEDIMQSELGQFVLAYEIGQLSMMHLRSLFTEEHLRMLSFVRRQEAPERWERVLEPQKPYWEHIHVPRVYALAVIRIAPRDHRVTCLHLGQQCLQFIEPLPHERLIVGDVILGPVHRWVIGLNGGQVGRTIHFDRASTEIVERLQQEQQGKLKPVETVTTLLFPSEGAADHACWLLACLGLTVGQMRSMQIWEG